MMVVINLKQALLDPATVFSSPKAVLLNTDISREQKINILKRWASDIREISVAEEENMQGKGMLDTFEAILDALHVLEASIDPEHTPPTKHGG